MKRWEIFHDPDYRPATGSVGYRGASRLIIPRQVPMFSWWRAAFYPWSYPGGAPDGRPDSPLCHLCGLELRWPWEPGLAVVVYSSDDVEPGETCFRCGTVKAREDNGTR